MHLYYRDPVETSAAPRGGSRGGLHDFVQIGLLVREAGTIDLDHGPFRGAGHLGVIQGCSPHLDGHPTETLAILSKLSKSWIQSGFFLIRPGIRPVQTLTILTAHANRISPWTRAVRRAATGRVTSAPGRYPWVMRWPTLTARVLS